MQSVGTWFVSDWKNEKTYIEVSTMNPRDHFTKINLFPWKITELKVTLEQTNLRVLWKRQRPILLKYCIAYFRSCGVLSKNCSFIYVKKIVHSHTLEYDGTVMSHGRRGRGEFWSRGHSSWRDNLGGERTCPLAQKALKSWLSDIQCPAFCERLWRKSSVSNE